jgi:hypothetical protein
MDWDEETQVVEQMLSKWQAFSKTSSTAKQQEQQNPRLFIRIFLKKIKNIILYFLYSKQQ